MLHTTEVAEMHLNVDSAIRYTWEGLGIVWLIGLAFTKRTVRAQSSGARMFQIAFFLLGFALLGGRWFGGGWMGVHLIPVNCDAQVAGLTMTVAGCLFAIWARLTLGGNWSGRATVKEGHELIIRGPYSLARHPIYTGILLACVGTGLSVGQWRCILGLVIIVLGFMMKMSQEERLMMETFPQAYPAYRQRVRAIIPGVF